MINQKVNGIYYTPSLLADYLAKPLIRNENQTILDPSYGEGSLLLAAERVFKEGGNSTALQLYGCDTKPVNGLLKHLPKANLQEIDFFDYQIGKLFHTVLMNPPYIRHHIQDLKKIKKYRLSYPNLNILNNAADLWAFFLVKAVSHLEIGGNIGAILPWAFLQADYSKSLREWLADNFREIKVVALSDKYFENTPERIVVLWLTRYGEKSKIIKIASSNSITPNIVFSKLPLHNWNSDKVFHSGAVAIETVLSRYKSEFGFKEFSNYADVKIGVVTGAVDYFIKTKSTAKAIGFNSARLKPILTTSDEFSDYLRFGQRKLEVLVALKPGDHLKYRKYIKDGIKGGFNQRSHSKLRDPWYVVRTGSVPDAFFHYRITNIPFLLPNTSRVQCTNSIHRIYYKKLTITEIKWLTISILSSPSQLSIETNSKIYGGGVLKIEPKSLKNSLVIIKKDKSINATYKNALKLLANNKKKEAKQLATEFIYKQLNIPRDLIIKTEEILNNLQDVRHPKGNKTNGEFKIKAKK